MNPGEALGAVAQIAVTLAGFAGVVVVFNKHAAHEWSRADRFRLQLILLSSAVPLALCLAGMLLLTTTLPAPTVWALCSALAFAVAITYGFVFIRTFLHFRRGELKSVGARRATFFIMVAFGCILIFLQLYNAIVLSAFWPFFVMIISGILTATLEFTLLIFVRRET